jgi:hypothetical protein
MRIAVPIFVCAVLLVGCMSHPEYPVRHAGYYDFTVGRSPTCEIHHLTMTPKLVDLEFGLRVPTEMDRARPELFPHADEPYDTGFCVPLEETRGNVFVCPRCTEARTGWFSAHKTAQK